MKNKVIIIICAVAAAALIFVALAVTAVLLFIKNRKITISFNTNGGKAISEIKIKKGETITLPEAKKTGYILDGWFLNGKRVSVSKKYYKDTTLEAKWIDKDAKTFTVKFDSDGGSKVDSIKVECGKGIKLPTSPTKEGYVFVSWVDKNNLPILDDEKLACEDVTFKAWWEKDGEETTTKKTTTKKTTEKAKSYKCPSGYTLSGTKCTTTTNPKEECPSGYSWSGKINKCVARTTVSSWTCGTNEVYINGYCYSNKVEFEVDNHSNCDSYNYYYVANTCYKNRTNLTAVCPSGYKYYHSEVGIGLGDVCAKLSNKEKKCSSGYSLSGNSCVKTIDATY